MNPGIGLYVHFPWCVRKCPYCDFNSHPVRGDLDQQGYLEALGEDLRQALSDVPPSGIDTVFFGGGTPSLFSADAFQQLLSFLSPWLAPDAEVTMEANPGTTEHRDFAGYRRAGINRLSIGAQSFDAAQLRALGRIHGPGDTARAVAGARRGGFDNINLDLMYGLPEQPIAAAMDDLRRAIDLAPEHLSWYQLTIEPRTEFARRPPILASDDQVADMEEQGLALLAAAGYQRYEISGFARAGRRCRHNLNYWTFGDYLGAGAGAHGKRTIRPDDGILIQRTAKPRQPRLYLADPRNTQVAEVSSQERIFEFMMNALRLVDGTSFNRFESATGLDRSDLAPLWDPLVQEGLVHGDRVAATPRGLRHLDTVLQRFLR